MKKRVLAIIFCVVTVGIVLSGCNLGGNEKKKYGIGLHEYWATEFIDSTIVWSEDGKEIVDAKINVTGTRGEGDSQTFLVLPEHISGYEVIGLSTPFESRYANPRGPTPLALGNIKALVIEANVTLRENSLKMTAYDSFDPTRALFLEMVYFKSAESFLEDNAFGQSDASQYPIIFPDSIDIDARTKNGNYDQMDLRNISECISEYKTEDGFLWSIITDETNLVLADDTKLYKDELLIIASEEMESITFPETIEEVSKVKIITSEKQPEGAKITVNISNGTNLSDSAFADDAEIVEIIRY